MGVDKMKEKKCKNCLLPFQPTKPLQYICDWKCASEYARMLNEKKEQKQNAKEKVEKKKALMTLSEWLKLLQVVFNKYIRLRDKNKPCVSCNAALTGKYDAGHFYSVGAYPSIRFDEANVHGQCVACNQHKHGNITEYALRLPERIGSNAFEYLTERRNLPKKYSIPEVKELIELYKERIKQLNA